MAIFVVTDGRQTKLIALPLAPARGVITTVQPKSTLWYRVHAKLQMCVNTIIHMQKLASKNRDLINEVEMLQDLVKKLRHDAQTAQQQQVDNLSPQELAMQEGMDNPLQPFDPYISLNTLLDIQPQLDHSPLTSADEVVGGREQELVEQECTLPSSLRSIDSVSTNIVD